MVERSRPVPANGWLANSTGYNDIMPEYIEICEHAARAGARELMAWRDRFSTKEKGPKDLVTEADLASQRAIEKLLAAACPDHRFLGEEDGLPSDLEAALEGYCWVVDPLDGTTNYVHQIPAFAVSVALCHNGEPVAGVIYDPILDECFAAERGAGAALNGSAIAASGETQLDQALVAASFSTTVHRQSDEIERFLRVLVDCRALRRLGSAALNLAYLGCGRLDAYWATSIKPWDVAAGWLIASEAGARLTHIDGGPFRLVDPRFAGAGTEQLLQTLYSHLDLSPSR